MKKSLLLPLLVVLPSMVNSAEPVVKKSTAGGICHDQHSSSYNRTKNFTPFDSIASCRASGGVLPKNQQAKPEIATGQEYEREFFGHGWNDEDGDCMNTRHEILLSHALNGSAQVKSDNACSIAIGQWKSPFTDNIIHSPSEVDIDHIAPLKFAWTYGAAEWSYEKRVQFANDPENLLAVEASLNRSKGAQDITEWLPPANKCEYINKFLYISGKYGLVFPENKQTAFTSLQKTHCA